VRKPAKPAKAVQHRREKSGRHLHWRRLGGTAELAAEPEGLRRSAATLETEPHGWNASALSGSTARPRERPTTVLPAAPCLPLDTVKICPAGAWRRKTQASPALTWAVPASPPPHFPSHEVARSAASLISL
jgi:hypothetical protein